MKIIIAGGRDYSDYERVKSEVRYFVRNLNADEIVIISGSCDTGVHTFTRKDGTKVYGADGLGERLAEENNWKVEIYPADWKQHGKKAGPYRNTTMVRIADALLAFHDGESRGTSDVILKATNIGLKVEVFYYNEVKT